MVPTGYTAYVRVLHPLQDGRRWREIAASNGRVLHPLAQWSHFFDTLHHPNLWPPDGHLPRPDHDALLAHLPASGDVTYAVWEGHGFWGGGTVEAHHPDLTTYEIPVPSRVPRGAEPVLGLPHRRYHLFRATLAAHEVWVEDQFFEQSANLVWPDGHDWCLATEIDVGFTLLGCARGRGRRPRRSRAGSVRGRCGRQHELVRGHHQSGAPAGLTRASDRRAGTFDHTDPTRPDC